MPEFEDKTLLCKDCSKDFTFTSGEQEFFASKGFENEPTRCSTCKAEKKRRFESNSRGGDRGGDRYGSDRGYSRGGDRDGYSSRDRDRDGGYSRGGDRDGYSRGGDRRDRDRDRRTGCFNCGSEDHFSRDCDKEQRPKDCYSCGKSGHISRDCDERRNDGPRDNSCHAYKAGNCRYGDECRFSHHSS